MHSDYAEAGWHAQQMFVANFPRELVQLHLAPGFGQDFRELRALLINGSIGRVRVRLLPSIHHVGGEHESVCVL